MEIGEIVLDSKRPVFSNSFVHYCWNNHHFIIVPPLCNNSYYVYYVNYANCRLQRPLLILAWFRCRSTHVPNLIGELSPPKEWCLNQFGTAVLIQCAILLSSTRSATLFDTGVATDSYGALLMCRTKCINYDNEYCIMPSLCIKYILGPTYGMPCESAVAPLSLQSRT